MLRIASPPETLVRETTTLSRLSFTCHAPLSCLRQRWHFLRNFHPCPHHARAGGPRPGGGEERGPHHGARDSPHAHPVRRAEARAGALVSPPWLARGSGMRFRNHRRHVNDTSAFFKRADTDIRSASFRREMRCFHAESAVSVPPLARRTPGHVYSRAQGSWGVRKCMQCQGFRLGRIQFASSPTRYQTPSLLGLRLFSPPLLASRSLRSA